MNFDFFGWMQSMLSLRPTELGEGAVLLPDAYGNDPFADQAITDSILASFQGVMTGMVGTIANNIGFVLLVAVVLATLWGIKFLFKRMFSIHRG